MNSIKITVLTALLLILFAGLTYAIDESGGHAGAFLRIPVGARPAGMGNAFVSIADDANALYFNPGGIYQVEGMTFAGMYSLMSMDRGHYQGNFIYSHEKYGTVGVMFIGYSVGKIDGRDISGNATGEFSDNEMAFSLTYGRKLLPVLGVGGSIKYISHSLDNNKATGLGYDIGAHLKFEMENSLINQIGLGISMSNLGASLKWDTDLSHEDEIPATLRYGANVCFNVKNINFLIAGGGTQTTDELAKYNAGIEAWILDNFCVRTGLDGEDINFGASIKYNHFQFDYGFCPDVLDQGATSKLAIQIKL